MHQNIVALALRCMALSNVKGGGQNLEGGGGGGATVHFCLGENPDPDFSDSVSVVS